MDVRIKKDLELNRCSTLSSVISSLFINLECSEVFTE